MQVNPVDLSRPSTIDSLSRKIQGEIAQGEERVLKVWRLLDIQCADREINQPSVKRSAEMLRDFKYPVSRVPALLMPERIGRDHKRRIFHKHLSGDLNSGII